jgi:hypothetical protein
MKLTILATMMNSMTLTKDTLKSTTSDRPEADTKRTTGTKVDTSSKKVA